MLELFQVGEVLGSDEYLLVSRTLSPHCRRWRKPTLRRVAGPVTCTHAEVARGAGLVPRVFQVPSRLAGGSLPCLIP